MSSWKTLSLSLAGLKPPEPWPTPRAAIEWVAASGFRSIQLDAAMPGMRPRELDTSARRGVVSLLRRLELELSGFDLWIPPTHFSRADTQQRALDAVAAALELAADLRGSQRMPVLSLNLPSGDGPWREHISEESVRLGVPVADYSSQEAAPDSPIGLGLDGADLVQRGIDVSAAISRAGGALFGMRLTDSNGQRRLPVGRGKVDLLGMAAALAVAGFDRPVVVDGRDLDGAEVMEAAQSSWPPL